jgi:hypothetical protein
MTFKTIALAAVTAAVVSTSADAAPSISMDGTFAASIIGISSNTPSIDLGSVLTNTNFTVVGSATGDLNGSTGTFLTVTPFTATDGSAYSFTSTKGNFTGTLSDVLSAGPVSNRVLTAYALGTFTPAGTFASFAAGPASLTFSFTQNNANGAISGGFTMSTPPVAAPGVPEPAAWAMLIAGFGLTGAAMRRRRIAVAA